MKAALSEARNKGTEMLKLWENPMLSLADRLAAASGEIDRLCDVIEKAGTTSEIALRIKTEEHQCCTEDLMEVRRSEQEGWKEAAIAWEVCASIHETWAKKKDALYSTRHADFEKHAEHARQKLTPNG